MAVSDRVMRHLHKAQGEPAAERHRAATFLPEPEPRPGTTRSSRSTITSSSPRTSSKGACPPRSPNARRASSPSTTAARRGCTKTASTRRSGLNAVAGRPEGRVEHGAGPLRRDAARLLRRRSAHPRHGSRRRVRDAVLPVADRRLRGHDLREEQGPRARPRVPARVERLAHRGVGRTAPRPHHPAPARVAARSRDRGRRRAPQRRARLQGRELPGEPGRPRAAVGAHRPLGSVPARVRGDARPSSACTTARRRGPRPARRARRSSSTRRCSR